MGDAPQAFHLKDNPQYLVHGDRSYEDGIVPEIRRRWAVGCKGDGLSHAAKTLRPMD